MMKKRYILSICIIIVALTHAFYAQDAFENDDRADDAIVNEQNTDAQNNADQEETQTDEATNDAQELDQDPFDLGDIDEPEEQTPQDDTQDEADQDATAEKPEDVSVDTEDAPEEQPQPDEPADEPAAPDETPVDDREAPSEDAIEKPTQQEEPAEAGEQLQRIEEEPATDEVDLEDIQPAMKEPTLDPDIPEDRAPLKSQKDLYKDADVYLHDFLQPWSDADGDLINFDFENAELLSLIQFIEQKFNVTFIRDDMLNPVPQKGKSTAGIKISFRTNDPMTRDEAWNLFLTFLNISGLSVQPGPNTHTYRIAKIDPQSPLSVTKGPLPTFIGTSPTLLPENDMYVRYVYFVKNADLSIIKTLVETFQSGTAPKLIELPEVHGILITDRAYNIRSLMAIAEELDQIAMPETVSVIKLQKAKAGEVAELYKELTKDNGNDQQSLASRLIGNPKQQTLRYFTPGTRVIAETRTNRLIVMGNQAAVEKVEEFIKNYVDTEIELPYLPIHIVNLRHVPAESIAAILQESVAFTIGKDTEPKGGVIGGNKLLNTMSIVPNTTTNQLIITASYDDFYQIHEVIEQIDIEQPQIAFKVLVYEINIDDVKRFGIQLRNKKPGGIKGLISDNINFQTSGLNSQPVQERIRDNNGDFVSGAERLLGDLVKLATGAEVGSTLVSLGSDMFGVWGLLNVLQRFTNAQIIANPFVVTANKTTAELMIGETRRVQQVVALDASGQPQTSFDDLAANLSIEITPQISSGGLVTLDIKITNDQFASPTGGDRTERTLKNTVIAANNQTIAIGGLVRNNYDDTRTGVPVLKDIPGLGWLFKNEANLKQKTSLLILITPEILPTHNREVAEQFTNEKLAMAHDVIKPDDTPYLRQDPVHRWFFNDNADEGTDMMKKYEAREQRYTIERQRTLSQKKKDGHADRLDRYFSL